jgi:hypothetical protein
MIEAPQKVHLVVVVMGALLAEGGGQCKETY